MSGGAKRIRIAVGAVCDRAYSYLVAFGGDL